MMSTTYVYDGSVRETGSRLALPGFKPKPLGFWATAGWFALGVVAALAVTFAAAILVVLARFGSLSGIPEGELRAFGTQHASAGLFGSSIILYAVPTLVMTLGVKCARWRFTDYVALVWPRRRDVRIAIAATVVLIVIETVLEDVLKLGAEDHEGMLRDYRAWQAASGLPLLWLTVVILAPVCEEIWFRGFLLRGWAVSWLGIPGSAVVTSVVFGAIHLQYSITGMADCLALGLVCAWLRLRSGSVATPILLHMLNNGYTTLALAVEIALTT
jgi:membrane protease YdiL (CAAX protease family)